MNIARTDRSSIGRWWWTVDHWTLFALISLAIIGAVMTLAASPPVAARIGADHFHFVKRQLILLPPALMVMFCVSLLSPQNVRRLAVFGYIGSIVFLVFVLLAGSEIKGARRWINLAGFSLQPSEFVKPCFAVVAAWMFSESKKASGVPGRSIAIVLYVVVIGLLLAQPDLGQAVVVSAIWFTQFFLAGLPLVLIALLGLLGIVSLVGAYFTFSHVQSRINRFLDPQSGDSYQIERSLDAFQAGGVFGRGPGEGTVKFSIPDAHADFIFSVTGEEFGLIVCLFIVSLFTFIVIRGFLRLLNESSLFILLAGAGLLVQFGLQAVINMASSLHLMPTKGMTLPFVSYGGSSLLALGLGMGMLLALTRRRFGQSGDGQ